jgi:hypothetical protein
LDVQVSVGCAGSTQIGIKPSSNYIQIMLSVCFYVSGLIAAPTPASGEYEALQELYSVNGKPAPEFKDGCYVSAGSEFECDANMLVSL